MKLTNKQYDTIKWVALVLVPASATLILTVGKIWELRYYDNIAATITAFGLFLAAIIGVSSSQYYNMVNEECEEYPELEDDEYDYPEEDDDGSIDDEEA